MSTRVTEYYDCFDVKTVLTYPDTRTITSAQNTALPDTDKSFYENTNNFRGFNNFPITDSASSIQNPKAPTPDLKQQYIVMHDIHKAPQVVNNISIDDAGNILCYPPNISVPYWNRVIFKHFDYDISPATNYSGVYKTVIDSYLNYYDGYVYNTLSKDSDNYDITSVQTKFPIYDYRNVPVFVKYDMYPSRTKVVYSSADKWNQNSTDIVHNFNYHHSQMEPIKLSISLSASNPVTDPDDSKNRYNQQLTYDDIQKLFKKCYWSIEWIYDRTTGN